MQYTGEDKNSNALQESIEKKEYIFEYKIVDSTILLSMNVNEKIAELAGHLYIYPEKDNFDENGDAFHIDDLWTDEKYQKRGIATYLMKKVIEDVECRNVKHISVNSCAFIIEQESLNKFYGNFFFSHEDEGISKERGIELI